MQMENKISWTYLDGTLTFSGEGSTEGSDPCKAQSWQEIVNMYQNSVTAVVIGNGVTQLEDCDFSGCENLTSVTISGSVEYIGEAAFIGC